MAKILLIDIDSKMPNLALMKLSAYHKQKGDTIYLNESCNPDKVYISCVFSKNRSKALGIAKMFNCPVEIGGYGVNEAKLPNKIEHTKPDYDLYDCDFSTGFTTRGCLRRCEFCNVWKMEGNICEHSSIEEFWDPRHRKIILLDNNILGLPSWKEKLAFICNQGLKLSLMQGYDARLIDEEAAALIADIKHYNWKFDDYAIYTAWDYLEDEKAVLAGIQKLIDAGIKSRHIIPYMLVGFNTTIEQDLYRFEKLRDLGVYPFVMPYNGKGHPMKWWGQRPAAYKSIPFETWHRIGVNNERSY